MKLQITNSSYSTALTFELATKYDLQILSAPVFPSFQEDAFYRSDLNKLTIPLFIQYKLGEYLIGNNSNLKDFWGIPYYRFLIQSKNNMKKHQLLLRLEEMDQLVFYTAPEFYSLREFYSHLMQGAVLDNSIFCPPQRIGELTKDERYFFSYKSEASYGLLQPGGRKIDGLLKGNMLFSIFKQKFETNKAGIYDNDRLRGFGDEMLENYLKVFYAPEQRELIEDIKQGRDHIEPRDYLSLISILLYECYVYMISI